MRAKDGAGDTAKDLRPGSVTFEVGEDCEDSAVVVVGLGQAELGQDAAHVLLDGSLRDPEPAGHTGGPPQRA
jgi:hypothetical protein